MRLRSGKIVEADPPRHVAPTETGLAHDGLGAVPSRLQAFNEAKPGELRGPALLGNAVLLRHIRGWQITVRAMRQGWQHGSWLRAVRDHEESTLAVQFLLHGIAQIAHEMKAVGDLPRLRRTAAHAVGIGSVPIATDDPNRGMGLQPRGYRISRADREHINHVTPLQIDENRAEMLLSLLPRPVVDADDANRRVSGRRRGPACDSADHAVGADHHAEPTQQPLAGAAA
jgi:hypothetical protein